MNRSSRAGRAKPEGVSFGLAVGLLAAAAAAFLLDQALRPAEEAARLPHSASGAKGRSAGKGADTPADIPPRGWWAILRRMFSEVINDRVMTVAGGVTFYGLLALFPAITLLVSLYGLFVPRESIVQHLQTLASLVPEGGMSIISEQVQRITSGDPATLGAAAIAAVLLALWSANSGTKSMIDALNIAYDAEEKRSFVKLTAVSLLFTVSAVAGLIVLLAAVAVVPPLLHLLWLGRAADLLISVGRWPLLLGLTLLALAVLYRYGPCRPEVRWRWITPGSLLASAGLLALSMLFSWYAANFGKFNETYGSLGAAIGFLIWMWLSISIILVGAELNAEVENQARPGPKPGETGAEKK